jgi:hypothetical protein
MLLPRPNRPCRAIGIKTNAVSPAVLTVCMPTGQGSCVELASLDVSMWLFDLDSDPEEKVMTYCLSRCSDLRVDQTF